MGLSEINRCLEEVPTSELTLSVGTTTLSTVSRLFVVERTHIYRLVECDFKTVNL